jgi:septin family protein
MDLLLKETVMTQAQEKVLKELDVEEVVDFLIDQYCFSPVVDAIVANLQGQLEQLNRIKNIIKDDNP